MEMFVFLSLLALASAAPYYGHHDYHHRPHFHHQPPPDRQLEDWPQSDTYFGEDVFDTRRFWEDLASEMHRFDQMLNDFTKHFPNSVATEGLEGDEYKVTVQLAGFEEKEIVVKAKEGVLMIQAVHKTEDGNERTYLDLRTLPSYVNVSGSWMYENGVLKIAFPVTEIPKEVTETPNETPGNEVTVEEATHATPKDESREEMGGNTNNENNQDADVGLKPNQAENDKENELLTNIIPKEERVEATTYAVDLKGEVEFVPVRY